MAACWRLAEASIESLFGRYNHKVHFPNGERFAILYGINGIGKTKFLEAIHAASTYDCLKLVTLKFRRLELVFANGRRLVVERRSFCDPEKREECGNVDLTFSLYEGNDLVKKWQPDYGKRFTQIVKHTRFVPIEGDMWIDESDKEIISLAELVDRYPRLSQLSADLQVPPELVELKENFQSIMIDTHRLRTDPPRGADRSRAFGWRPREERYPRLRVGELSKHVIEKLNEAQRKYSRESQNLDRTFPARLFRAVNEDFSLCYEEIKTDYDEQSELRSRLARVFSTSLSTALPIPDTVSEAWKLKFLELYIEDAKKKLGYLTPLLERIELFEQILNERLHCKSVHINAESGLQVSSTDTNESIPLHWLSSGEQHEIVLIYELLMQTDSCANVIIDEPEISLHIVWQEQFIPDISKIAELVDFTFIIATHSPEIIGEFRRQAISLDQ